MQLTLHKNARTTPSFRRELRGSNFPLAEFARRYNVSERPVPKSRSRGNRLAPPANLTRNLPPI